jgi:hypothetical protein
LGKEGNFTLDNWDRPLHIERGVPASIAWKYRTDDVNTLNLSHASIKFQDFSAHPVLAVSWGNVIFIKVYVPLENGADFEAKTIGVYKLDWSVKTFAWLSGKVINLLPNIFANVLQILTLVNDRDEVFALDALTGVCMEMLSIHPSKLLQHDVLLKSSSLPKLRMTQAEAKADFQDKFVFSFDASMTSTLRSVYLLCECNMKNVILQINLRSWDEFLDALVAAGFSIDALKLSLEFWDVIEQVCFYFLILVLGYSKN